MNDFILWGVREGRPDWDEEIITTNKARKEEAKRWARTQGFDRFREANIDMTVKPDFKKAIR